jgi:hypothetical protein
LTYNLTSCILTYILTFDLAKFMWHIYVYSDIHSVICIPDHELYSDFVSIAQTPT